MPAFIALAALFGTTVMGLSAGAAIVLAGALAPTDPVLAGDIGVGPPGEEDEEHEPHFGISAEAGFNDGLAFPFVLLGLVDRRADELVSSGSRPTSSTRSPPGRSSARRWATGSRR